MDELVGRTIGPYGEYRLEELLGRGEMGAVYRAELIRFRRNVAVKVFNPVLTTNPRFVRNFPEVARAITRLEHWGSYRSTILANPTVCSIW